MDSPSNPGMAGGVSEVDTLDSKLKLLESDLIEHYCQIGKLVLELCECKTEEIGRVVDDIIETKRRLILLRGETRCDRCLTVNTGDSKFCKHCGETLDGPA